MPQIFLTINKPFIEIRWTAQQNIKTTLTLRPMVHMLITRAVQI